jgi:hypothetical protein
MTLRPAAAQRFRDHRAYLADHEPGLRLDLDEREGTAALRGTVAVPAGGSITERFTVEIRYQRLDPFRLPRTYDPVRRFPPSDERHIQADSEFCLWLPQTAPDDFGTDDGLALHLDRVKQFLVLQLMYEHRRRRNITPRWPGEQWGHGLDGHEEWAREQIARYPPCDLSLLRRDIAGGRRATSPDALCPCRSGRTFRACHRPLTELLKTAAKDPGARAAVARLLKDAA